MDGNNHGFQTLIARDLSFCEQQGFFIPTHFTLSDRVTVNGQRLDVCGQFLLEKRVNDLIGDFTIVGRGECDKILIMFPYLLTITG
ncbi:hypothetical protein ACFFUP_13260 [Vibrio ostreicida]|uniref:hypothetical protein n=1 Tax=Vibrio ostreicida TaxID=526588 RepID=UPI00349F6E1B